MQNKNLNDNHVISPKRNSRFSGEIHPKTKNRRRFLRDGCATSI